MTYPQKIPKVPQVEPGSVLHVTADNWLYGRGVHPGQTVDLVVEQVRDDLAYLYGGHDVWVEGHATDCAPGHPPCRQLLVHAQVLRTARLSDAS
jgi:hypothetical protein